MTHPAPITNWPVATRERLLGAIFDAALPICSYRFEHRNGAWNVEPISESQVPQQYVAPPDDAVLDFLVERLSPALALFKTIYGIVADEGRPSAPPPDGLLKPAKAARKPRRPTLARVAKQTEKAGIADPRFEFKPDGSIVVIPGTTEPIESTNPWDVAAAALRQKRGLQ